MTINRHNYEKYLIDYLDGKLNPLQIAEVVSFLQKNKDIQDDLEGLQEALLPNSSITYPHKSELKKNSFHKCGIDSEFEYLCIAHTEGDITIDEKKELDSILRENLKKAEDLKLFEKAKASPNLNIIYEEKGNLKRLSVNSYRRISYRLSIGIAASAIIAVTIYSTVHFSNTTKPFKGLNNIENAQVAAINKEIKVLPQKEKATELKVKVEKPLTHQAVIIDKKVAVNEVINKTNNYNDSIPNQINRIEPKPIVVSEDLKQVQLAMDKMSMQNNRSFALAYDQSMNVDNYKDNTTKEIGFFEIVQYGVKSLGKLIGRDVKLDADKDKNGNIEKIKFESQLFAFSAPVGKKE